MGRIYGGPVFFGKKLAKNAIKKLEDEMGDIGKVVPKGATNLNRKKALNQAKDLAGVPRSQQPSRQWQVGEDIKRKGMDYKNYEFSSNPTHHGRYYEYNTPQGKRVIAEHTNDGRVHTHAGRPNRQANQFNYDFKKERYDNIYGPNGDHDIYYK
ncbi:HNH/endonuclease VII fold putative polymorphic toxin [Metabacillus flavus]|uniref:HNH/endonuclease VII fold putative polymorphic toxin n=1 Tax=Metabacillus flavus TaxID=2823519 RepID=UPI0020167F8F|nr:HNH/endonuclease VII fold putative polymorphic toxin [Metabacillus flavus]